MVLLKSIGKTHKSYCCSISSTSCTDRSLRARCGSAARHFQIGVIIFFFSTNKNRAKTRLMFFVPGDLAVEWLTDCDTQLLKKRKL